MFDLYIYILNALSEINVVWLFKECIQWKITANIKYAMQQYSKNNLNSEWGYLNCCKKLFSYKKFIFKGNFKITGPEYI